MVTRRDFLKTMSMASAGLALGQVTYCMLKRFHPRKEEVTR